MKSKTKKGTGKMKKLAIITVLTMVLAVGAGKAHALDSRKFGPALDNPETLLPNGRKNVVPFPEMI